MSLKELTASKHKQAENSVFMQTVFAGKMPLDVWGDYTYNKYVFYREIENRAMQFHLLDDILNIQRASSLWEDCSKMINPYSITLRKSTLEYVNYIKTLEEKQTLAHVYVWHMGDLYGGQMIKKLIPEASHLNLEFDDPEYLRSALRTKLFDNLADESNIAFDWAIRIMDEYTENLS